jgi:hypothetical protein
VKSAQSVAKIKGARICRTSADDGAPAVANPRLLAASRRAERGSLASVRGPWRSACGRPALRQSVFPCSRQILARRSNEFREVIVRIARRRLCVRHCWNRRATWKRKVGTVKKSTDQLLGMILSECASDLRRRLTAAHHVFTHAALTLHSVPFQERYAS